MPVPADMLDRGWSMAEEKTYVRGMRMLRNLLSLKSGFRYVSHPQRGQTGEKTDPQTAPAASTFRSHTMFERRWLSGVYDDIKTQTRMHDRQQPTPLRLTFYDD